MSPAVPAAAAPAPATTARRGRVVTPDRIIDDGAVVVTDRHIAWVGPARDAARAGFADAVAGAVRAPEGGYVLPGLVDVHCHGGGGQSFPNAETAEQAMTAVMEHRRAGTTSLVASCVTAPAEVLRERTAVLADLCERGELAAIHFEGPFVSVERCGAQDPACIIDPDANLTRELIALGRGHVATMTIAPEKPGVTGDDGVIAALIDGGALPSLGHTDSEAGPVRAALADAAARPGAATGPPPPTCSTACAPCTTARPGRCPNSSRRRPGAGASSR